MPRSIEHSKARGFTLVELVVVIILSGILATVVMQFVTAPIDSYMDQSRRARLVDIAQGAVNRIAWDVQRALPNSFRVGCGGSCVEFLQVATGGRYRAAPAGDELSFVSTDADTSFEILGPFSDYSALARSNSPSACVDGTAACIAVYNTGLAGTDAWNRDHVGSGWRPDNLATLSTVSAVSASFNPGYFSSGDQAFPAASPQQRFFIVDTPVTFLCDTASGTLRRYQGYSLTHPHSAADEHAELIGLGNPAEHALLADRIDTCSFSYAPGTPSRNGLLTVRIRVAEAGEGVTLLEQVHVSNMP